MAVLKNKRHEAFCRGIVKGLNQSDAYVNAGFTATSQNSLYAASCKLAKDSAVQSRIAELQAIVSAPTEGAFFRGEIADRTARVQAQNDRWQRLRRVIKERAELYKDLPGGGSTGLLVLQKKIIGSGKDAIAVDELRLDASLLAEMRELEKHSATELGQWSEKQEVSVRPAEEWDFSKLPLEDVIKARDLMEQAHALTIIDAAPGSVDAVGTVEEGG